MTRAVTGTAGDREVCPEETSKGRPQGTQRWLFAPQEEAAPLRRLLVQSEVFTSLVPWTDRNSA